MPWPSTVDGWFPLLMLYIRYHIAMWTSQVRKYELNTL